MYLKNDINIKLYKSVCFKVLLNIAVNWKRPQKTSSIDTLNS